MLIPAPRIARRRHGCRPRRGTAAVEFALAAPVLFVMLFAIIEFGRVMFVQNSMANAAREGCRIASLATTTNTTAVDAIVQQQVSSVAPVGNFDIDVAPGDFSAIESGTPVTVDVRVRYADISWIPVAHLVGEAELRATSAQIRE